MQNKPDFYYIPTAIDRDVVEVILNQYKEVSLNQSSIIDSREIDLSIRNSKNCWIATDNWISGMMKHFVEVANNNYFNYDLAQWCDCIQYTFYDEKTHIIIGICDITQNVESDFDSNLIRKLSISLILSDPSE